MTKLIFIRHAESDISIKNDMNRPLTNHGLVASNKIPHLFTGVGIDQFYSSPSKRAMDTIKPLAEKRGKDINICPNLRERNIGVWTEDFFSYAKKQWQDFNYRNDLGESLKEVQVRCLVEIDRILRNYKDQTIVIGTHGTVLCTILNYFNEKFDYDYFLSMVDKMPFFIRLNFNSETYVSMEELYVETLANVEI